MTIRVKDADDQNPIFTKDIYRASVSETTKLTGLRIREKVAVDPPIHAFDLDSGINARLRYSIVLGNEGGFFEMHDQTGELFLVREIDLESLSSSMLTLQIQASQVDNPLRQATSRVDVFIIDVNDNSPIFENIIYNVTVMENLPTGFTIVQVSAFDADKGENAEFRYVLKDPIQAFQIDPYTGWISVKDPNKLDRELNDKIILKVMAIEKKPNVDPDYKEPNSCVVEITLLDSNDNNPQFFPSNVYTFSVLETASPGTLIGSIYASDRDINENGRIIYYKQNDSLSQNSPFDVYPQNGSIYVTDRFSSMNSKSPTPIGQFTFFVVASDMAKMIHERRTAVAIIRVNITDINNSVPEFIGAPFEAYVGESLPEGAYVTQIIAQDADQVDTMLEYSIVAGNDEKQFIIDSKTGKIYTSAVLDYETKQSFDLLVQVSDGINTAVAPLLVNLVDINDNSPQFTHDLYNFTVVEELGSNVTVGTVMAIDRDSGKNSEIHYSIIGDHANELFFIEQKNGMIRTRTKLDRETESRIEFLVIAYDGGTPQLSGSTKIIVQIEDINDNAPYFEQNQYEIEVAEEIDPPVEIFRIQALDRDTGDNAVVKYLILAGNEDNIFNINTDNGLITTSDRLNFERKQQYKLFIAARNLRPFQGPNSADIVNPSVEVLINVKDINDEIVEFDQQLYHYKIPENLPRGKLIGSVSATNPKRSTDELDIVYWIEFPEQRNDNNGGGGGENQENPNGINGLSKFNINSKTGEIIVIDSIDFDPPANEKIFEFKINARDMSSINLFNSSVPVIIEITDVNDNSPKFNEDRYGLELPESLPPGTSLPPFYQLTDNDSGRNGKISYYKIEGNELDVSYFFINHTTGMIILNKPLDYEQRNQLEFDLIVADGGDEPRWSSAKVNIYVANINEFSPKFIGLPYEFHVQEKAVEGTNVGQVKAIDDDGNNVYYSIHDEDYQYFSIESDSGRIYVRKPLDGKTQYQFIVRATDDGLPQNFSLGVQIVVRVQESNDYPPVFTSNNYFGSVFEFNTINDDNGDEQKVKQNRQETKPIIQVKAMDKDLQNNTITYSIVGGNDQNLFRIDEQNGQISINQGKWSLIDYDKQKQYSLLVQAKDSHQTPLVGLTIVTIDVKDISKYNHPPIFNKPSYTVTINENKPAGYCFLKIEANSGDSVDNVSYFLSNGNRDSQSFQINKSTGDLCTRKLLDREQQDRYEFFVIANDGKFETTVPISIEVLDENDNQPLFEQQKYVVSIPYDSHPGQTVIQVHANDPDMANNGEVTYWIKNTHGMFEIDSKTGLVRLVSNFPNNKQNFTFEMEVFAQDHGITPNIGKAILVVRSSNTHNHPPKFEKFFYSVEVEENLSGIAIVTVKAQDPDQGKAGKINYRIVKSTNPSAFRIDRESGQIMLISPLDYEQARYHEINIEARDEAKDSQFIMTVVQIKVIDQNDHKPEILSIPKVIRIPQSVSPNEEIIYTVQAIDLDSDEQGNNVLHFSIEPPNPLFQINPHNGQIFARQKLMPHHDLFKIIVRDQARKNPLSSSIDLQIEVYNDHVEETMPLFTSTQYSIQLENIVEPGRTVLVPKAKIPSGGQIWYNISSSSSNLIKKFTIDHDTGRIFSTQRIEYINPRESTYHFIVLAHNKLDMKRYSEASVVIRLSEMNTKCPKFPFSEYYASIEENSPVDMIVINDLMLIDMNKYSGQNILYQITEDNSNDNFYIDTVGTGGNSGENNDIPRNVTLKIKRSIDRDRMAKFLQGIYTLSISASNAKCTANIRVKILIEDVNDNSPIFSQSEYLVELKENTPVGHVITTLNAKDNDESDDGKLKYFIVAGNNDRLFHMETKTGVISVNESPDREKSPAHVLKIVAIDSANNTGWTSVHIIILDENDWTPTFLNETFMLNVTEGPTSIGTRLRLPVVDYDDGINRQMEVYIVDGNSNGEFRLDVDEGGPLLTVVSELDREKYNVPEAALHLVFIAAKDKGQPPRIGKTMVAVIIQDINDSPPKFEKEVYYHFISEDSAVGMILTELHATDADSAAQTNLVYSFSKNTGSVPFAINPVNGIVNVSRQLDVSESQQYSITVEVFDGIWKSSTLLNIIVNEAEERDPRFEQAYYRFEIRENLKNYFVGKVDLKPRKHRVKSSIRYTIINSEMRSIFNITSDGEIYTRIGLDREKRNKYVFTVKIEEKHPTTKVSVSEVIIDVLDENDQVPTFPHSYTGTIKENSKPGTTVNIVPIIKAIDNDIGNNSMIEYSLSGDGAEMFSIMNSGSVIFTPLDSKQILDREIRSSYKFKVIAQDMGGLSSATDLLIQVEDENDNAPQFQHGPLFVLLPEIAKPGSKVVEVRATDIDEGQNSRIQYYITGGGNGDIRIDRITGEIFVVGSLKPGTIYFMNVSAVDGGGLSARTTVNVTIIDVNNHKPTFDHSSYTFNIVENNYTNDKMKLGVLRARDEDIGRNGLVEYLISSNVASDFPFSIDVHTGELFAQGFIDREQKEIYTFEVTALDYGEPPSNSTVEVKITILDKNDEKPRFYTDPYLAHVPENLDPGHKVTQIAAFDPDLGENGQVFYKLGAGHDNKFYIDGKDGTVWTLSTLDFEEKNFYNITVIAYDKGTPSLSSTAKLWVTVADTPDSVPDFSKAVYTVEVAENAKPGDIVYKLDAGDGPFKYYLLNSDEIDTFSVDKNSGKIKLVKPLDSNYRNHYRLIVKSEDSDGEPPKSDTAEVNIIVGTGQGVRLFPQRLYEVQVKENQLTPILLIDLNSTDEIARKSPHYRIVGSDYRGTFKIEHENGRLLLMKSLDREKKDVYHLKIKAENVIHHRRVGRDISTTIIDQNQQQQHHYHHQALYQHLTTTENQNNHLAYDEALVVIHVMDENDNSPIFDNNDRPIVAAIPLEASFGFKVVKVNAKDADVGINSAIRYELLSRGDDSHTKFYIDPLNGDIRSMVTFNLDGGKMYGFDVKATDCEGSENGNSATTTVFIHVLPETKMILFVADREPIMIEKKYPDIIEYLSNTTDFDVKLAKLGPHLEGDIQETHSTDVFLYAVNKNNNEIVDTETLLDVFRKNSQQIVENLRSFRIRRIQGVTVQEKISQMGATEIAIIALSSVIFLGTVLAIALLCSSCKERKIRQRQTTWEQQNLYNIKNPLMAGPKSIYGSRGIPVGNISNYSCEGFGNGDYMESMNSFKRNGSILDGRSAHTEISAKSRQISPPDGASALMNPPHSPPYSERYSSAAAAVVAAAAAANAKAHDPNNDWSGYSRGSGRSRNSFSGTSWSSRKSKNSDRH
uniref:Protocadherin Fat 4-like n=1 Tax=Dermatophagoides pteronyssinus TaxID=6956 RepID=A0A6P6YCP9_DERPT|nr:protocadherin Fat 4-like [Dermatophagoides pteronyssinus]